MVDMEDLQVIIKLQEMAVLMVAVVEDLIYTNIIMAMRLILIGLVDLMELMLRPILLLGLMCLTMEMVILEEMVLRAEIIQIILL